MTRTVVIPGFLFEVAVSGSQHARLQMLGPRNKPSLTIEWLDGKHPRRVLSEDGYDLVYHIPNGIKEKSRVSLIFYTNSRIPELRAQTIFTDLLVDYGQSVNLQPATTADRFHRNNPNSYTIRKGEVAGVKHFVKSWHGIGRTVSATGISERTGELILVQTSPPVISGDYLQTASGFHHATALLSNLTFLSIRVNEWLRVIDPLQYQSLETLMTKVEKDHPYMKALKILDPLLMEGRAIMYNRTTPPHRDSRDPRVAWSCLVVLGRITSGALFISRLNLRVRYMPGDVVWIRGHLLEHEVEVWEGAQRICIAHFTHNSMFTYFEVECKTGKAVLPAM